MIYFRISFPRMKGSYAGFTVKVDRWGLLTLAWLGLVVGLVLI